MKKRVAILGCGWSNECLMAMNAVFTEFAQKHDMDLFFFINYSVVGANENADMLEANIFRLPDMSWFDGAIILGNTLHIDKEFETITQAIRAADLPAVCIGHKLEGISCIECDNYAGMYELALHLVEGHGFRDILFISGPRDNQESNLRKQALIDALEKNGATLKAENIICGNWNYYDAQTNLMRWLEEHGRRLPEAIVCANDVMAMGSYVALAKNGYSDYKNVIVTGFDDLVSGYIFSPGITSVNPGYQEMAEAAMHHLMDCMENGNHLIHKTVQSKVSLKASCGCDEAIANPFDQGGEIFLGYERMVEGSYLGGHMCELANAFSEVYSREDIGQFFEYLLSVEHRYEGEEFYVCFMNDFFDTLDNGEVLKAKGYTETSELIGGICNNRVVEPVTFLTRELYPFYNPEKETNDTYLIFSLISKKECYGYTVMVNNLKMLYDYSLFVWSFNMGQNIERLRQNLRMEDMNQRLIALSVTDALTGVYNRMGCERIAFPLLERCYSAGRRAVMMFLDINKMKMINDDFGHDQGDAAIRMTANAIKLAIPDDWIVVRYGGDEFLVAGECREDCSAEQAAERIQHLMAQTVRERRLPYPLSAGIGFVYIEPEEKLDLRASLRMVDAKMYATKKERRKR